MHLPKALVPTTTEVMDLPKSGPVSVHKATPRFSAWSGPKPNDYGGKSVLDYGGRPAFAELAILWSLQSVGWEGVWVDNFGGRKYRIDLLEHSPIPKLPP